MHLFPSQHRLGLHLLLCCLVAALSAGCGETKQQVIDRYKPRFAAKREELRDIARTLAGEAADADPQAVQLNPRPIYRPDATDSNTEFVMLEQLEDPDVDLRAEGKLDLLLSDRLITCMQWTGPKNPMVDSALRQRAGGICSAEAMERALATKYLVVLKTTHLEPPQAIDDSTFTGGQAQIDGFVVDLATQQIVCSFRVESQAADSGSYEYKEHEDRQARMLDFVGSSLWLDARRKVGEELSRLTGGEFDVD